MDASTAPVRSTDQDALVSRASAAALGYINDSYASLFLSPAMRRGPAPRRPPLINLGTHARTWAVDQLVRQFLSGETADDHTFISSESRSSSSPTRKHKTQILSLGAGTDTRFWRMRDETDARGEEWNCARWLEVDFQEATCSKARTIVTSEKLKNRLGGEYKLAEGGTRLEAEFYSLVPGDLRNFSTELVPTLESLLDPNLPTLLLAECVFVYLPPDSITNILGWFANTFTAVGGAAISYDPFGLNDNFGKVMLRNLAARNLTLPAAESTPNLQSLSERILRAGFLSAESLTVKQIRDRVISPDELQRIAKIEQIDEVEELNLVLEHYAVTAANLGTRTTIHLLQS